MKVIFRELIRELRWMRNSHAALAIGIAAILMAGLASIAAATSTLAAVSTFRQTLGRYREYGEDISAALGAPSSVEGGSVQQVISNPLRNDLDQVMLALTQLEPTGAISSTLSLSALVVLPIVGFALGVFMSTHDVKSGSIIFRWPQSGIRTFLLGKPLALIIAIGSAVVVASIFSVPFAMIAKRIVRDRIGELSSFATLELPSISRVIALVAISSLIGVVCAACGLLVGSTTRNRTFTVTLFSSTYLLLPLLGPGDPRNLLPLAGRDILYFVGQFRPVPLGDLSIVPSLLLLVAIMLGCTFGAAVPWALRSRREGTS